jgi:hypothetical protein
MPPIHQLTHAIRTGEYRSPRTVLGFFAGMVGIAATVLIFVIWLLEKSANLRYLIPIVLTVFLAIFLFVLVGVMLIALKDPSKLMLGQISGRDYAEIQRVTLGDSRSGEHVENVMIIPPSPSMITVDAAVTESNRPESPQLDASSSTKDN